MRDIFISPNYDIKAGREVSREGFEDGHVVDWIVAYAVAWHKGQLLGWVN